MRFIFLLLLCTTLEAKTYLISDTSSDIGAALILRLTRDGHQVIQIQGQNPDEVLKSLSEIDGLVLITPRPKWDFTLFPSQDQWLDLFQLCFTAPLELVKKSLSLFPDHGSIIIISQIPQDPILNVLRSMWITETSSLQKSLAPLGLHVAMLTEEKASAILCQAIAALEEESWQTSALE